jgi:hypothetical protein
MHPETPQITHKCYTKIKSPPLNLIGKIMHDHVLGLYRSCGGVERRLPRWDRYPTLVYQLEVGTHPNG